MNTKYLHSGTKSSGWLRYCEQTNFGWGFISFPSVNVDADLKIEHHIESVYLKSKEMILLGDPNINYLDQSVYSKHRLAKVLKSLNMTQHVTVVTRPSSKSCLDHVYRVFACDVMAAMLVYLDKRILNIFF